MNKKALILYISRHSGHFHAATALESGLLDVLGGQIKVRKVNALSYTNPVLEKIVSRAYLEVIKNKPELWGHIYDNSGFIKRTRRAREALHKFNMSKVRSLVSECSPDIVLCTQAFPCGMVADYKRTEKKDLPLVGILTDHAPHSYWLHEEVDLYITPFEETADALSRKGVDSSRIKVCGIPVSPKFLENKEPARIRKDLGVDGKRPAVMVMGGSQGLGAIEHVVRSVIERHPEKYDLMVITGANKKLKTRLGGLARRENCLKVFSFVDNIDEIMQISDLIITKAGGMTIAESLSKELPMLIVDPIPGHERMNADFLVKKGAAVEVRDWEQVPSELEALFSSKDRLEKMKSATRRLSRPDSAVRIAETARNMMNM